MNINAMLTEPVTTLTVCILINRKEILPHALCKEDVVKGVLMSWTHVKPRNVRAPNETTFLVTYSAGILAVGLGMLLRRLKTGWANQCLSHAMR